MNEVLNELLDRGEQFDPIYLPSKNTDHMPMTLIAMHALGAADDLLTAFHDQYQTRLRPVQESPQLAALAEGIGQPDAFAGLRQLLFAEVAAEGYQTVVKRHLPQLLPSLAAGAFHPLIRLGFAVSAEHEMEVASALAYWYTTDFQPNLTEPTSRTDGERQSLQRALEHLPQRELPQGRFGAGLAALVENDWYPAPVSTSLADCAATSLDIYQGTRNFFALHFVTATQAARVCAELVAESSLISALTAAIQAGYLVVGAPDYSEQQPIPDQLDDEHNLKYMYACRSEYMHYGDERYLAEMNGFVAAGLAPKWIAIPAQSAG